MDLRIFTEPQQGASYDDLLAVAKATEDLGFDAFFRSDHYLSMGDGDGLPGPTDAWTTLAGLARETSRIRLGTLVSSATFRHPGVLAIQVAQVDQMSGGRVELGLGAGWFAAGARRVRHPVPGQAVRPAHRAARADHRSVGDAGRVPLRLRGRALHADRLAGAAEARAVLAARPHAAGCPGHRRRQRPEADARARRQVRERVQHVVPRARRRRGPRGHGPGGVRGRRSGPVDAHVLGGAGAVRGSRRRRGGASGRRDRPRRHRGARRRVRRARRARWSTGSAPTASSASRASTCRCSTCTTSTTSSWWRRRWPRSWADGSYERRGADRAPGGRRPRPGRPPGPRATPAGRARPPCAPAGRRARRCGPRA